MNQPFRDLTGQRFGRLVVVHRCGSDLRGAALWDCDCDCGGAAIIPSRRLVTGHTRSCGCIQHKHGCATEGQRDPLYQVWLSMRQRCRNPKNPDYADYGGRGITVCESWDSFVTFAQDVGERPEGLTLDRLDNDGPYSKENCRWSSWTEQANNRRPLGRNITMGGLSMNIAQWARSLGIPRHRFYAIFRPLGLC